MVKNHLKEIRMKEFMMNKKEFAKFIDVNYVQYIGYEKGTVPYLEVALRIAKKLNRKIDIIFYLDE